MIKKLGYKLVAYIILVFTLVIALYITYAANFPTGAQSITEGFDQTINISNYPASSHDAIAGNITEINLTGTSQTMHWQGYWGEITGTLTLDDASNWTLYDWSVTEPEGEIYATVNTTPDWYSIWCFNFSVNYAGPGNLTQWENFYNMTYWTEDGINETFTQTSHRAFAVGDITIPADTCQNTYTYVNDNPQSSRFLEVLLTDQYGRLIFTTLIENDDPGNNTDPVGYNGQRHDFQMLVAEDGTSYSAPNTRNVDTTTYYFYIEME